MAYNFSKGVLNANEEDAGGVKSTRQTFVNSKAASAQVGANLYGGVTQYGTRHPNTGARPKQFWDPVGSIAGDAKPTNDRRDGAPADDSRYRKP